MSSRLSQEIWPGIRASDPECPAFILTGPLSGTQIPQSSDWVIATVNADLSTHICASHCHGYLGARLRRAGWDGIVLRGRAASCDKADPGGSPSGAAGHD